VIAVEGVCKTFRHDAQGALTLKDLLLLRARRRVARQVLDGVTLRVARGETVGIVGKNGCGKTTLLRLIAGILRPDRGAVSVEGRVAPLLALGAGFHPDLTGEENVYLNASILGFTRRAMRARFADIVEFAGIGEHMQTPLRYYSAGMTVRLGFAVAVHLDPDVLLVDEVLAVGDSGFRTRCQERFRRMQEEGRTIVVVTHDMSEVREFCMRAAWLADGRVAADGDPDDVVTRYLASYR